MSAEQRKKGRGLRKARTRKIISGSTERPRLTVYKSLKYLYAQVVDDSTGKTLVSASTKDAGMVENVQKMKNMDASKLLGEAIGKKALGAGIKKLVFDKNGYMYHGKIAAIVDKVRESGIAV